MGKASVRLSKENYTTEIRSGNHVYYADEPVSEGGNDAGPTPSDMIMGSLGACIAITIRLYAERKGWDVQSIEIDLDSERFKGKEYPAYEGDERYVHEIRKAIRLQGDLSAEQRERLIEIGGMCPVHRLIATPTFFVEKLLAEEL